MNKRVELWISVTRTSAGYILHAEKNATVTSGNKRENRDRADNPVTRFKLLVARLLRLRDHAWFFHYPLSLQRRRRVYAHQELYFTSCPMSDRSRQALDLRKSYRTKKTNGGINCVAMHYNARNEKPPAYMTMSNELLKSTDWYI